MLEQLRHLVELQYLEDKKSALCKERDETPLRLADLDQDFARFESEYLLKKTEYENALKMHRTLEKEVADLESKLSRTKSRMSEIKNNREYQAMLKEIEDLKKSIEEKEDQILEYMESVDAVHEEVKRLEREVGDRRNHLEEAKTGLVEKKDQVTQKLTKLEQLQEAVRAKLQPELLKRWESLRQYSGGVAVAPVENGNCQICHMNLPPQRFIELQRDEQILNCPHCHRFIYWPGHDQYCFVEDEYGHLQT